MVDFKARLRKSIQTKPIDPIALYETLDRASDKGPLRPAQLAVLKAWHSSHRETRDAIVKLHTGQGKTLVGLLMLQSRLNENRGPAVYLCPDNYLVNQTCTQAKQFGLATTVATNDLPEEFLSGNAILVTTAKKLFNGRTKFGLGAKSVEVGAILLDDCHACVDNIKSACSISLARSDAPYKKLLGLFTNDLRLQGSGTLSDINNGDFDALLPVPYWAWIDQVDAVTEILSAHTDLDAIKYPWPLLRDGLAECLCVITGKSLEITPYLPPLHLFGSYASATTRLFMSATVTDDSFLIKGLGLSPNTITNPIVYPEEKWCGEKMVLVPALIDQSLQRDRLIARFTKRETRRTFGIVAMCPSFHIATDWKERDCPISNPDDINSQIQALRDRNFDLPLVIVNRYDGVDLPDDTCRILVFDTRPNAVSLHDRYFESIRPDSELIAQRVARNVEQGIGRSVRGEKDYCAIVMIGSNLIQAIRNPAFKKFYSAQTKLQIEIGLEIAEYAREDIRQGADPVAALWQLIRKVLNRDEGWKEFYVERMSELKAEVANKAFLELYELEMKAEKAAIAGRHDEAARAVQSLIDRTTPSRSERGWYVQEMARHTYRFSKTESTVLQASAHSANSYLLKPKEGMIIQRLEVSHARIESIIEWVKQSTDHASLMVRVDCCVSDLRFGVDSDRFEAAFDEVGKMLGFATQRPDKQWNEGPDNLWSLEKGKYLLVECKNKVDAERTEIHKTEAGQLNTSLGWFRTNYKDAVAIPFIVHPAKTLGTGAAFTCDVSAIRIKELKELGRTVRQFFMEFAGADFDQLSKNEIQKWITKHRLDADDLTNWMGIAVR